MKKVVLIVCCMLISFGFGVWYRLVPSGYQMAQQAGSYVIYPVLVVNSKVAQPIRDWWYDRQTYQNLYQQVALLQKNYERVQGKLIALYATRDYAHDIDELVAFKKKYAHQEQAVIAQVLASTFTEQSHYFLVDAGAQQGIEPNMVVLYNNNLVGRVSQVYPWYSKVTLITDRSCKIAAYCSTTDAQGVHHGMNDQKRTKLAHVSHLATIKKDDLVISSGEGLIFPRGFALGTVVEVIQDGLQQMVSVEPLIDLQSIRHCMIVPKSSMHS